MRQLKAQTGLSKTPSSKSPHKTNKTFPQNDLQVFEIIEHASAHSYHADIQESTSSLREEDNVLPSDALLEKEQVQVANSQEFLINPSLDLDGQSLILNYGNKTLSTFQKRMLPFKEKRQNGKLLDRYNVLVQKATSEEQGQNLSHLTKIKDLSQGLDGAGSDIRRHFFSFFRHIPHWEENENLITFFGKKSHVIIEKDGEKLIINEELGLSENLLQRLKKYCCDEKIKSIYTFLNMISGLNGEKSFLIEMKYDDHDVVHQEDIEDDWLIRDWGSHDAVDCTSRSILRLVCNNFLSVFEEALDEAQKDKEYWSGLWNGYVNQITHKALDKRERALSPLELKVVCHKIYALVKLYVDRKSEETFTDFIKTTNTEFQNGQLQLVNDRLAETQNEEKVQKEEDFLSTYDWQSAVNFIRNIMVKESLDHYSYTQSSTLDFTKEKLDTHEAYGENFSHAELYDGIAYKFSRKMSKLLVFNDIKDKETRRSYEKYWTRIPLVLPTKKRLNTINDKDFLEKKEIITRYLPDLQNYDKIHGVLWREIFLSSVLSNESAYFFITCSSSQAAEYQIDVCINGHVIQHTLPKITSDLSSLDIEKAYKDQIARTLFPYFLFFKEEAQDSYVKVFSGHQEREDISYFYESYTRQKSDVPFEDYILKIVGEEKLAVYNHIVDKFRSVLDSRSE